MSESKITTKAIDNILNSSAKISKFKITPNYKIKSSIDYISLMGGRAFTLAKLDDEHKAKFSKFLALTETTTADFGWLCKKLTSLAMENNCDFKINPILELYEELLKENWDVVKYERDLLDSIDMTNKTPESNMKICEAIINFIKEHVLVSGKNCNP